MSLVFLFIALGLALQGTALLAEVARNVILKLRGVGRDIAVFAPIEFEDDNVSWVPPSYKEVIGSIVEHAPKRVMVHNELFRKVALFPIIINPYGGVYPEKSLASEASLNEIFEFVHKGGIYVNIGDIPFYFAYSQELGRKIDATPRVGGTLSITRSFFDTVVAKRLGVYVFGSPAHPNPDMLRVITLAKGVINHYHEETPVTFTDPITGITINEKASPIVSIKYGQGRFLFSTLDLRRVGTQHLKEVLRVATELSRTA